jgi:hypothetical protein
MAEGVISPSGCCNCQATGTCLCCDGKGCIVCNETCLCSLCHGSGENTSGAPAP